MPKEKLTVYVEGETLRGLEALAKRRGRSKSLVAEAAIAAFVTPDAAERQEAAIARRLDQQNRTAERLERNLGIAIEMLALYVRHWLTTTPPLPDAAQAAAQARGRSRYDGFVAALGRRLARGASFTREISEDVAGANPFAPVAGSTDEGGDA